MEVAPPPKKKGGLIFFRDHKTKKMAGSKLRPVVNLDRYLLWGEKSKAFIHMHKNIWTKKTRASNTLDKRASNTLDKRAFYISKKGI